MYLPEIKKMKDEVDEDLRFYLNNNNFTNEFQVGYNRGCFFALYILKASLEGLSSSTNSNIKRRLRQVLNRLDDDKSLIINKRKITRYQLGYDYGYMFINHKYAYYINNLLIKSKKRKESKNGSQKDYDKKR